MNNRTLELFAVSAAVGELESLAESGLLPEPAEQSVRIVVAHLLSAFSMPSKHERSIRRAANTNTAPDQIIHFTDDPSFAEILEVLRAQMGATL